MPQGLRRIYAKGHLHFVTCSCYGRNPYLGTAERRDAFVSLLEKVRAKFGLGVIGYVVMPEHFHLLMEEHEVVMPSAVMKILKQRYARCVPESPVWSARFYDFNVWSMRKVEEKLGYMHLNPVRRGLVAFTLDWKWSSAGFYAGMGDGVVTVGPPKVGPVLEFTSIEERTRVPHPLRGVGIPD